MDNKEVRELPFVDLPKKLPAMREMLRRHGLAQEFDALAEAVWAVATGETSDDDWEMVPASALAHLRRLLGAAK